MPFPGCVPELTDGVVRLRAHRPEDAERIVEQCNDTETMRWTTVPRPYGMDDAHAFLAKVEHDWGTPDGVRHWAVTDAADAEGRFLGTVDLRPRGGGAAETGFGLHPSGRGQGLMAGALRLACRWWFAHGVCGSITSSAPRLARHTSRAAPAGSSGSGCDCGMVPWLSLIHI